MSRDTKTGAKMEDLQKIKLIMESKAENYGHVKALM